MWLEGLLGLTSPHFLPAVVMLLDIDMIALFIFFRPDPVHFFYFFYHTVTLAGSYISLLKKCKGDHSILNPYYFEVAHLTPDSLLFGSWYIFFFDFFLILFLITFSDDSKPFGFNKYRLGDIQSPNFAAIMVLLIAIGGKLYLMSVNQWGLYGGHEGVKTGGAEVDTIAKLAKIDVVMLLILGYMMNNGKVAISTRIIYIAGVLIGLGFAFLSQMKNQILEIFFIVLYNAFYAPTKKAFVILLIVAGLLGSVLFTFIAAYRQNPDSISDAIVAMQDKEKSKKGEKYDPQYDEAGNRLNYHRFVCMACNTYEPFPEELRDDYLNNIIGLIPRFLWPGKPIMTVDTNVIGHEIGAIHPDDMVTSIGLSPVGEAYYLFGVWGVIFAPSFIGVILYMIRDKLDRRYPIGYVYVYFLSLTLSQTDSYVSLFTFLLKLVIVSFPIILIFNRPLVKAK